MQPSKQRPKHRIHPTAVILLFAIPNTLQAERKVHPATGHGDPEGKVRYTSTLSLTFALDGIGGQHHAPAAFTAHHSNEIHCTGGWGRTGPVWTGVENIASYRD